MTVLKVIIEGKDCTLYIDGKLEYNIQNKVIPQLKDDNDWVWVIDGEERSGKSVLGQQLALRLDPTFCIERICMTPNEFRKAIHNAKKGQAVIYDEAFTGLSSKGSLTEINKILVEQMMEMGAKNLIVILILPTLFLLEKYAALFRTKGLFHVYKKKGKRGFWRYYNKKKKKLLYLYGKKLMDYSKPHVKFRGRFLKLYAVNEQAYRDKKDYALAHKDRKTKSERIISQRNAIFWYLNKKLNINQTQIAKICKELEIKLDRTSINEIIRRKEEEMLESNVNLDNTNQEEPEDTIL